MQLMRPAADRELLFRITKDDLIFETFRAGGKGGQNQNKRDTAARVRHPESGAVAESRTARTQLENKRLAFARLVETDVFKSWLRRKVAESMLSSDQRRKRERSIADAVEQQMQSENIIMQVQDEKGQWVTVEELE